ncbi:uncharacterized protein SCHCODRAFT_02605416 [Schizophyllum commune H4-8]|uniref:Expressed protein n=1 Tax=Schizophyllum commune (strain H4-8 / FGSC 9210) TaxID=578458 RepID=D8PSV6_SCHCM|nr:uncharacterized protein SCHCODRAFT_02605416 [Schizophyllum commune H4-8]KAI5899540.1 hypothetical protein SCHCODRAFT_02605416 [Schizophyllum commune H4-8]
MVANVEIIPHSETIHMYGPPDTNSAYTVSGVVRITPTSSSYFFERHQPRQITLQSLVVTFEGQSETLTPTHGYRSVRLCTTSRQLVPNEPIHLTNDEHDSSDGSDSPCSYDFVFNIPVAGWLPESTYLRRGFGTRYVLHAAAQFGNAGPSSSWTSLCVPFFARTRSAACLRQITIRRFGKHPSLRCYANEQAAASERSTATYVVPTPQCEQGSAPAVPDDIIKAIQTLVSVPEFVDVEEETLNATLRLRTKGLDREQCKRLQIPSFSVDVEQSETFRAHASHLYEERFPLPSEDMQPPQLPLLDGHPDAADLGMFVPEANEGDVLMRTFSLLHPHTPSEQRLGENNRCFARDAEQSSQTWYTLQASIPYMRAQAHTPDDKWAGRKVLKSTVTSPLFTIGHALKLAVTVAYELDSGEQARAVLKFDVPLRFSRAPPPPAAPAAHVVLASSTSATEPPSLTASAPYAASSALPAYSNLYDASGNQKVDYSDYLPRYAPAETPSSSELPDYDGPNAAEEAAVAAAETAIAPPKPLVDLGEGSSKAPLPTADKTTYDHPNDFDDTDEHSPLLS